MKELYSRQDKVLSMAAGNASLNDYIYGEMAKYYVDVDRKILKIVDFTKIKRREIAEKPLFSFISALLFPCPCYC